MKTWTASLLALCLAASLTACGSQPAPSSSILNPVSPITQTQEPASAGEEPLSQSPETTIPEPSLPAGKPAAGEASRILIAYFTWAENTQVEDPSLVDVDAVTSASVLLPGNVGLMAQWIQEETGGDTFSILTAEPYSSDYDECLDRAIREHDDGLYPALTAKVENMEDYDIVFLGFPNWWYSCPMAILTFIQDNDLSGKTIVPFASHGTGGFAASLQDIGAALPEGCTVLQEFGAYRPEVKESQPALLEWLRGLGLDYEREGENQ